MYGIERDGEERRAWEGVLITGWLDPSAKACCELAHHPHPGGGEVSRKFGEGFKGRMVDG